MPTVIERSFLVRHGVVLLLAGWSLLLASWAHFGIAPQRPLMNDEAVEMLQTVDLPLDRFYFLAPAHRDRWCEVVESVAIYLNRIFVGPGRFDLTPVRLLHAFAFVVGVLAFYAAAKRSLSRFFSVAASFVLAASSLNLFYNQVLTRNYLSAPLGALILFFLVRAFRADLPGPRAGWLIGGVGCVLTLGIMSYSAFRPLAAALGGALTLEVLLRREVSLGHRVRQCGRVIICFLGVGAATGFLLWLSHTPLEVFVGRGTYSLAKGMPPWESLGLTWLSPVWLTRSPEYEGKFIIDETLWAFEQPYILWTLAVFYGLGLVGGLLGRGRERRPELFVAAWTVVLCQAILSAGGPNPKYSYVLLPFYFLLTFAGLQSVVEDLSRGLKHAAAYGRLIANRQLPRSASRALHGAVIAYLAVHVGLELRHLAGRPGFINDLSRDRHPLPLMVHYQQMHRIAIETAQVAIELARASPEGVVYMSAVWGGDLAFWMIRPYGNIRKIDTPAQLREEIAMRDGRPQRLVFNYAQNPDVIEGFQDEARRQGVEVHFLGPRRD